MRYLVLIAAVALSACAGGEANNNVSNETPQDASPARTERTTDRSTDPVPATSPAQQVNISKAQLIGLKKDEILNLLGRPSFQRRDPPAEIWRYRTDECLVDLYLYPPKTSDTTKQKEVTYLEARTPKGPQTKLTPCLNAVHKKSLKIPTG